MGKAKETSKEARDWGAGGDPAQDWWGVGREKAERSHQMEESQHLSVELLKVGIF